MTSHPSGPPPSEAPNRLRYTGRFPRPAALAGWGTVAVLVGGAVVFAATQRPGKPLGPDRRRGEGEPDRRNWTVRFEEPTCLKLRKDPVTDEHIGVWVECGE